MNWYRFAKSKLHTPIERKEGLRFLRYLKSTGYFVDLYHGTSTATWEKCKQKGYILAPRFGSHEMVDSVTWDSDPNQHNERTGRIYLTSKKTYTKNYASSAAYRSKSDPCILTIRVPLHEIAEIQQILIGNNHYINEYYLEKLLKELVESEMSDEQKAKRLWNFVNRGNVTGTSDEFTVYGKIPTSWVVDETSWKKGRGTPKIEKDKPLDITDIEDDERYKPYAYDGAIDEYSPRFDLGTETIETIDVPSFKNIPRDRRFKKHYPGKRHPLNVITKKDLYKQWYQDRKYSFTDISSEDIQGFVIYLLNRGLKSHYFADVLSKTSPEFQNQIIEKYPLPLSTLLDLEKANMIDHLFKHMAATGDESLFDNNVSTGFNLPSEVFDKVKNGILSLASDGFDSEKLVITLEKVPQQVSTDVEFLKKLETFDRDSVADFLDGKMGYNASLIMNNEDLLDYIKESFPELSKNHPSIELADYKNPEDAFAAIQADPEGMKMNVKKIIDRLSRWWRDNDTLRRFIYDTYPDLLLKYPRFFERDLGDIDFVKAAITNDPQNKTSILTSVPEYMVSQSDEFINIFIENYPEYIRENFYEFRLPMYQNPELFAKFLQTDVDMTNSLFDIYDRASSYGQFPDHYFSKLVTNDSFRKVVKSRYPSIVEQYPQFFKIDNPQYKQQRLPFSERPEKSPQDQPQDIKPKSLFEPGANAEQALSQQKLT